MTTLVRGACWLAIVLATAYVGLGSQSPQAPVLHDVTVIRDVPYKTVAGESLAYDFHLPTQPSQDLRPLVIALHGGSWMGGSRRDYGPQFAPLVRAGVAVAVVDYRLARPGAPSWDGALEDVRSALDVILAGAAEHQIDPRRVAALGTSAGGLLAARTSQVDPRISVAVCLSAPYSLTDLMEGRQLGHEPVRVFLGDVTDGITAASPRDHVITDGPSMLLIHGEDDGWIPIDQARKMHEKLDRAAVFNRLIAIPGARHGFELRVAAPSPRDLGPEILRFLSDSWPAEVE